MDFSQVLAAQFLQRNDGRNRASSAAEIDAFYDSYARPPWSKLRFWWQSVAKRSRSAQRQRSFAQRLNDA